MCNFFFTFKLVFGISKAIDGGQWRVAHACARLCKQCCKSAYVGFIFDLRHFVCFAEGVPKCRKSAKKRMKICICQKKAVILQRGKVGLKLFNF